MKEMLNHCVLINCYFPHWGSDLQDLHINDGYRKVSKMFMGGAIFNKMCKLFKKFQLWVDWIFMI